MKRRISKLLLFLLLGAIVNVAVAWGCVLSLPPMVDIPMREVTDTSRVIPQEEVVELLRNHFHHSGIRMGDDVGGYGEEQRHFGWKAVRAGWLGDNLNFDYHTKLGGWPAYSLKGWLEWDDRKTPEYKSHDSGALMLPEWTMPEEGPRRLIEYLPWHPLWPGFAINTVFYAAMLWLLFAAPGYVRRRIRARRGLCPACAYPIGTSNVCTECGKPVTAKSVEPVT